MNARRFLMLVALLGAAGCAVKSKPPLVNLWGRERIAVLPLVGDPADPALAGDVARELIAALSTLGAAPVADPARTLEAAGAAAATPWADAAWRERVATALGCDLVLGGVVREFRETAAADKPKRIRSQVDASWKWGVTDTSSAHLASTLTLAEARTGRVLWTRVLPGDGRDSRWTDLPWEGEHASAPPGGWDEMLAKLRPVIPAGTPRYASDSSAARARAAAIAEVVRSAMKDFHGRDGWEPPARK